MLSARVVVRLAQPGSLKDKRRVAASLLSTLPARFGVSVAEIEGQDDRRRLVLGLAGVSSDLGHVRAVMERAVRQVESTAMADAAVEWSLVGGGQWGEYQTGPGGGSDP